MEKWLKLAFCGLLLYLYPVVGVIVLVIFAKNGELEGLFKRGNKKDDQDKK